MPSDTMLNQLIGECGDGGVACIAALYVPYVKKTCAKYSGYRTLFVRGSIMRLLWHLPYTQEVYTWTVEGQPVPAPRINWSSKRVEGVIKRYYGFKDKIRASLLDAYPHEGILTINMLNRGKPFVFQEEGYGPRALVEYWLCFHTAQTGRCGHGDADNVVKTIFDALFVNDQHVMPRCMGLSCQVQEPSVRIQLTLLQQEPSSYGNHHHRQHVSRRAHTPSGDAR
jgi:hypothetical protein